MLTPNAPLDVLVIGAGQAGLAMGVQLRQQGRTFLLVDRAARIGESWRRRFTSLTLFTPRAYSALPGLPVPGDPEGYPTKDEIADYLEAYAAYFALPVKLQTGIARLERTGDLFLATTDAGEALIARTVVVATGAFQQPVIPTLSAHFAAEVVQLTPETYCGPAKVPAGTVLVVGDGATGRQIARELSATHRVILSTGRPRRVSKERILGKSIFWWMDKTGILRKPRNSAAGRFLRKADPFPGKGLDLPALKGRGVTAVGRLAVVSGKGALFAGAEAAQVDAVIWATGYRDDSSWLAIPGAVDEQGAFAQERGVSAVPGLYFIGRSWQWTRGSALLTGVGDDAAHLLQQLLPAFDRAGRAEAPALAGALAAAD